MTNSLTTQTAVQIDNVAASQTSTLATGSSRTITVRPSDIKAIIDATFLDYKGQKAAVRIQPTASYDAADLTWQGGSKTAVMAVRCNGGAFQTVELTALSPWSGQSWGGRIPADVMLVEHVIFCGKDLGIRCVVSPDSQFLPRLTLPTAVVELSQDEIIVLSAHTQLKPAYRGAAVAREFSSQAVYYNTVCDLIALESLPADRKVRL